MPALTNAHEDKQKHPYSPHMAAKFAEPRGGEALGHKPPPFQLSMSEIRNLIEDLIG
jgi:hypothetical protein